MSAKIALVDCDSFFVSCEQAENTSLQNKAVCVVSGENGCVVSRSKAAKQLGVKMGQPCLWQKKNFRMFIILTAVMSCIEIIRKKLWRV